MDGAGTTGPEHLFSDASAGADPGARGLPPGAGEGAGPASPGILARVGRWLSRSEPSLPASSPAEGTAEQQPSGPAGGRAPGSTRPRILPPSRRAHRREEAMERVGEGIRTIAGTLVGVGERLDVQGRRTVELLERCASIPDALDRAAGERAEDRRSLADVQAAIGEARDRLTDLPARLDAQAEPLRAEMVLQRSVAEQMRERLDRIPAVLEAHAEANRREMRGLRAALAEVRDVMAPVRSILADQVETTRECLGALREVASRLDEEREQGHRVAGGVAALSSGVERLLDATCQGRDLTADLVDETRLGGQEVLGAIGRLTRELHETARRQEAHRAEAASRRSRRRRISGAVRAAGVFLLAAGSFSLARAVASASTGAPPPPVVRPGDRESTPPAPAEGALPPESIPPKPAPPVCAAAAPGAVELPLPGAPALRTARPRIPAAPGLPNWVAGD